METQSKIEKLKKSLYLSELKYKTLFHNMLDGWALHEIILNDAGEPIDYVFLDVNSSFEQLTGLKKEKVIGRRVKDILPDTEDHWIKRYGNVAINGTVDEFEEESKNLKKSFQVKVYSPQHLQFVTVFIDTTIQKKLSDDRKQLRLQLQQAQKMEAIGTLAGGIAHDFNNILSAIIGYSELIRDEVNKSHNIDHFNNQVLVAANRAKDLVKRILSFSRGDVVNKSSIDPIHIVADAVGLLKASLPASILIKYFDYLNGIRIFADPTQLHQVVMNLCTNAFHAMELTGGVLTLTLTTKTITDLDIPVGSDTKFGNYFQLTVSDTGIGISPEIRDKIFNPYFTTKPIGKGTGMGLSMVHNIIQNHDGFISVNSVVGEGTNFEIMIPLVLDDIQLPLNNTNTDIMDTNLSNKKILLVDDEEILIDLGKTVLERLGYQVVANVNSVAALAKFKETPNDFDLIITDQNMPNMTGIDLSKQILDVRPDIPIILCTGYSSLVSREVAKSIGIRGFALKPFSRNDMINLIREVSNNN